MARAPGRSSAGEDGARVSIIETQGFEDYALLDSGAGRKLERFGTIVVNRPEPQALWQPLLGKASWAQAHAVFSASGEDDEKGKWRFDKRVPESWPIRVGGVTVLCKLQGLWHLGLFPEQVPHWEWMVERLSEFSGQAPRVLNLFAYTGAASLIAANAGAHVTHVDASKKAVAWAKENQASSNLIDAPVRWIVDDCLKFVAREVRREKRYDVILVDPPKFGRGPSGETWDLFSCLPELLSGCAKLMSERGASLVLTSYAIRASSIAFEQLCRETFGARGGTFDSGELALRARGGGLCVPTSLFVRYRSPGEKA